MGNEVKELNEETEVKKTKSLAPVVKITEKGILSFSNHVELKEAAMLASKLPITPDHLKNAGLEAIAAALLFLKQRGLPQTAMNQCAYVKGKLTQFGSLVTALAELHQEYGDRRDFFVDENGEEICTKNKNLKADVWAAVVQVKKKHSDVWNEYVFSVDDAARAGLLTKDTKRESGWIKYQRDMLFHKANARAMKANYASALEGVNYHEDLMETFEMKDVTASIDKAALINEKFKSVSPSRAPLGESEEL